MDKINPILVIYKNKILLTCTDLPFEKELWGFIGERKSGLKSALENATKELRYITKLDSDEAESELLPLPNNDSIFYIKLTDKNVNSIVRRSGQRLEFYGLEEIDRLPLSQTASTILSDFKEDITVLTQK